MADNGLLITTISDTIWLFYSWKRSMKSSKAGNILTRSEPKPLTSGQFSPEYFFTTSISVKVKKKIQLILFTYSYFLHLYYTFQNPSSLTFTRVHKYFYQCMCFIFHQCLYFYPSTHCEYSCHLWQVVCLHSFSTYFTPAWEPCCSPS